MQVAYMEELVQAAHMEELVQAACTEEVVQVARMEELVQAFVQAALGPRIGLAERTEAKIASKKRWTERNTGTAVVQLRLALLGAGTVGRG